MNTRLEQFLAAENISQSQLADVLGVARASISHIIAGRNKPGYEFICNLMRCYPALNIEWLMLGKGKMYKTSKGDDMPSAPLPQTPIVENQPVKPVASTIIEEEEPEPGLFDEPEAQDESIDPVPATAPSTANESPAEDVPDKVMQEEKPRKLLKIIALYDNNTWQELS